MKCQCRIRTRCSHVRFSEVSDFTNTAKFKRLFPITMAVVGSLLNNRGWKQNVPVTMGGGNSPLNLGKHFASGRSE